MKRPYRTFHAKLAGRPGRPAGTVTYGYSTREAGYPDFYTVLEKRGAVTVPDQTHSDHIFRAGVPGRKKRTASGSLKKPTAAGAPMPAGLRTDIADCDALVTTEKNQTLTIRTADCLPIFFWDPKDGAVAVAHAGWKGTHQKIAAKTVARLKRLGVDPKHLRIVFGPAIRSCCYEVGPEFAGRFDARTLRKNPAGRLQFDLVLANRLQLLAAGVPSKNIRDLKLCTACDTDTFFSFRRDPANTGRMVHWIVRD